MQELELTTEYRRIYSIYVYTYTGVATCGCADLKGFSPERVQQSAAPEGVCVA